MRAIGRTTIVGFLLACGGVLLGATGKSEVPRAAPGTQEVTVLGVVVSPRSGQPAVILQGKRDSRSFAMAIGPAEATGIAVPLQNVTPPRPLTHDLFLTMFGRLNVAMSKVVITDLRDDIYYAVIHLQAGGTDIQLDSRPSDAIALAIRAKVPVYVADRVFDKSEQLAPAPPAPGPRI
jgi:hypothetical protein